MEDNAARANHRIDNRVLLNCIVLCRRMIMDRENADSGSGDRVINIREIGARGDGVADDTAAIQGAMNAAWADARVYFPAGVFNVWDYFGEITQGLSVGGAWQY